MTAAERNRRYREKLLARSDAEVRIPETQRCSACQIEKPAADFDRSRAEPNGLKRQCRMCRALKHAAQKDASGRKRRLNVAYMERMGIAPKVPPVEETPTGPIMRVPLGKGEFAVIDAADWPLIAGWHWYRMPRGYAVRGGKRPDGRQCIVYMHKVIFGPTDAPEIDHKDRDKLNNRRSNLRPATRRQNVANCGPNSRSTSGIKGVSRTKSGRWQAVIYQRHEISGRLISKHLGTFDTPDEAARAYDAAARQRHGEFAFLNSDATEARKPPI